MPRPWPRCGGLAIRSTPHFALMVVPHGIGLLTPIVCKRAPCALVFPPGVCETDHDGRTGAPQGSTGPADPGALVRAAQRTAAPGVYRGIGGGTRVAPERRPHAP